MKVFSDNVVSKSDIDAAVTAVDAKQTLQIKQLRNIIALTFVLNLIITLTFKYLV